ncbi:MAG: aspartate/glutamate racemase family protein [Chloroflexi bacterium]|nr:aspartate/glutamate racemase family protein [Chloroflexota bacterium]
MVFNEVAARSPIPLLHIAKETGKVTRGMGLKKVGLIGTKFTMQADFYRDALSAIYGISVLVPELAQQDYIHDNIMNELVKGQIVAETRERLSGIAREMAAGKASKLSY